MNNIRLTFLAEPKLLFGHNQSMEDPRDGLTLFGPYENFPSYTIQAGVIGTARGIQLYSAFVSQLQRPIYSPSIARPTFPGFEAVFGIKWPRKPAVQRIIDEDTLRTLLDIPSLKERTYRIVSLFLDTIKRVQDEEETKVDLWFIVLPRDVWLKCRPKSSSKQDAVVSETSLSKHRAGESFLFPEMESEHQEHSEFLDASSDFHNQMKARLLKDRVTIPVQIILEPTLEFKEKSHNKEYEPEMKAHVAWTQSATVYYKLGKLPWKLQGIRRGVCYLGLVFKKYERLAGSGYACSAAQMFLDSGDGTVFKGNIGPWKSKSGKEYHLNKTSAKELLAKALTSYLDKKGEYPLEVFIHGRARFADEEWRGFAEAVEETNRNTRLVGVVIRSSEKLKLFRDIIGEDCYYGNLRGLAYPVDGREAYLWTRGFVPRLNTSTSLEIPNPLRIQVDRGNVEIDKVLKDILALSKLNYNACLYGDGLPVTLRFSDSVGSILTAIDNISTEVLPFKYYI